MCVDTFHMVGIDYIKFGKCEKLLYRIKVSYASYIKHWKKPISTKKSDCKVLLFITVSLSRGVPIGGEEGGKPVQSFPDAVCVFFAAALSVSSPLLGEESVRELRDGDPGQISAQGDQNHFRPKSHNSVLSPHMPAGI